jgi:hypothetical protein
VIGGVAENTTTGEVALFQIDTTTGSLLHRLALGPSAGTARVGFAVMAKAYLVSVAATYGCMCVAWFFDWWLGQPVQLRLPFWRDWNTAFMFLISFPTLVLFIVSDNSALRSALRRVQRDKVINFTSRDADILQKVWGHKFERITVIGQGLACFIGTVLAVANYLAYSPPSVGFWIASGGKLRIIGYPFLWSIWTFYTLISIYAVRTIAVSFLLSDIVRVGDIRMLPFHPDRCGGLRPVGHLGLRNQYGLTVFGINILTLSIVTIMYFSVTRTLYSLICLAVIAYVALGPVLFMGPLLPFRGGMLRSKSELMSEVAQRLRVELMRIRTELQGGGHHTGGRGTCRSTSQGWCSD